MLFFTAFINLQITLQVMPAKWLSGQMLPAHKLLDSMYSMGRDETCKKPPWMIAFT